MAFNCEDGRRKFKLHVKLHQTKKRQDGEAGQKYESSVEKVRVEILAKNYQEVNNITHGCFENLVQPFADYMQVTEIETYEVSLTSSNEIIKIIKTTTYKNSL